MARRRYRIPLGIKVKHKGFRPFIRKLSRFDERFERNRADLMRAAQRTMSIHARRHAPVGREYNRRFAIPRREAGTARDSIEGRALPDRAVVGTSDIGGFLTHTGWSGGYVHMFFGRPIKDKPHPGYSGRHVGWFGRAFDGAAEVLERHFERAVKRSL